MKLCLNCADKLLDGAKRCPRCGVKAAGFPIFDPEDKEAICMAIEHIQARDGTYDCPEPTFWDKQHVQSSQSSTQYVLKKAGAEADIQSEKDRVAQLDREGAAYCPKCHSTSLSAHKKGFGVGKAIIGAAVTAPIGGGLIGAAAGNIGSRKVRVTCLKCGHQFWAGEK